MLTACWGGLTTAQERNKRLEKKLEFGINPSKMRNLVAFLSRVFGSVSLASIVNIVSVLGVAICKHSLTLTSDLFQLHYPHPLILITTG